MNRTGSFQVGFATFPDLKAQRSRWFSRCSQLKFLVLVNGAVALAKGTLKRVREKILIVGYQVTSEVNGAIWMQKQKIYVLKTYCVIFSPPLLIQFSPPFITASMLFTYSPPSHSALAPLAPFWSKDKANGTQLPGCTTQSWTCALLSSEGEPQEETRVFHENFRVSSDV